MRYSVQFSNQQCKLCVGYWHLTELCFKREGTPAHDQLHNLLIKEENVDGATTLEQEWLLAVTAREIIKRVAGYVMDKTLPISG